MTEKYNNSYMRPNLSNKGEVPDNNGYCHSPDIWINGTEPMDYKKFLKDKSNYSIDANINLVFGKDNYIYVRCFNNTDMPQYNYVSLYYAPATTILNPNTWRNNVIYTDKGETKTDISVVSGEIGVCDAPFVWRSVPLPPTEANHYCLMAHMNDAQNTNPFPDPTSYVDIAYLLKNNLRWAQRNTTIVKPQESATMSFNTNLLIDVDLQDETGEFDIVIRADPNFKDWEVEYACSRPDSEGKEIRLKRSKITGESQVVGGYYKLKYGFNGLISVYAYNTSGRPPVPGQTLKLEVSYRLRNTELVLAKKLNVLNEAYNKVILTQIHADDEKLKMHNNLEVVQYVVVGGHTLKISDR